LKHRAASWRGSLASGAAALGAGALVAASLPPWGWWPLAYAGLAIWAGLLYRQPRWVRWRRTFLFSTGWLLPGMGWMWFLSAPGYLAATAIFAAYHAFATLATPAGPTSARTDWLALPCSLTAAEALRFCFPFGGVPLATLPMSQVATPIAGLSRVGGPILVTFVVALAGTNIAGVVRGIGRVRRADERGWQEATRSLAAVAAVPLLVIVAAISPSGADTGQHVTVAFVQGGGEQGTRAIDTDPRVVVERHLAATRAFDGPADIVVWPENVIDVESFATSRERSEVAAEAARLGVPFVVGITEDSADGRHFLNAQVVVMPDGSITSRYDKVRRVPFGEFMPLRGLLKALGAPTDLVPRDAQAGSGPAVLDTPFGRLGVMISWEVFFGGRARDGVAHGATLLVNPTNGSSYTGTVLQSQQVASSRLRAIENGRWLVQVSPTGFSAFVSPSGKVYDRTGQREAAVRTRDVALRDGRTIYSRAGDVPFVALVLAVWVAVLAWAAFTRGTTSRANRSNDSANLAGGTPGADPHDTTSVSPYSATYFVNSATHSSVLPTKIRWLIRSSSLNASWPPSPASAKNRPYTFIR
jgi:apolipoprotein N-acyltransferase